MSLLSNNFEGIVLGLWVGFVIGVILSNMFLRYIRCDNCCQKDSK